MKCTNCGAEIPEGALFCVSCGSPAAPQPAAPQQPAQPQQPGQPQQPVQPQQMAQPQQPVQPQQMAQPQQPVQPQMGQPGPQQFGQQPGPQMGQPQMGQPQMGRPGMGQPGMAMPAGGGFQGFMNQMKLDPIKWMEVGGMFLVLISLFIPFWLTARIPLFNYNESFSIFQCGWFWVLVALSLIVLTICQFLIWIDVIPPLSGVVQSYKRLPFSQFYVPGYVFIMCCLFFIVNLATVKGGEYLKIGFGISFWLCLLGAILAVVPGIIKLAQKQPYYA